MIKYRLCPPWTLIDVIDVIDVRHPTHDPPSASLANVGALALNCLRRIVDCPLPLIHGWGGAKQPLR
jgi:hypothetical protein